MPTNMYLKLDTIDGESTDSKHEKWIEILSWSHSFSQPTTAVRASAGATVEQCAHSDVSCTKYLDMATDAILHKCWSGKLLKVATVDCFQSDGDNQPTKYLMIEMDKVIVSSYSISAGAGDKPMENLSLSYGKVKYTYIDQTKDKGTAGGAKPISHDLTINKVE